MDLVFGPYKESETKIAVVIWLTIFIQYLTVWAHKIKDRHLTIHNRIRRTGLVTGFLVLATCRNTEFSEKNSTSNLTYRHTKYVSCKYLIT